ncbi:MAG TPA: hypothetical protein VJA28_00340 [Patescibacteria group bacterium]|nr:hypothetical protein [Patescibacteria group bacterium]
MLNNPFEKPLGQEMKRTEEGEEIQNEEAIEIEAQQVETEQPLNVVSSVEKNVEAPQQVESLDDIISNIETVEVESKELDKQEAGLLQEKINKGNEAIKPFKEAQELIKENNDVNEGEMDYGVLTGNEDAWLHYSEKMLDSNIAEEELEIQKLKAYYQETGKSLYGESFEEALTREEKTLEELKLKKENGFTDEEKNDFRDYNKGRLTSLQGYGLAISAIHESHMGSEGKKFIGNPSDYIDQMKKVRNYHHSEEYLVEPGRQGKLDQADLEQLDESRRRQDEVIGWDRRAQGIAFGALKAGDANVAAKALAFSEKVNKLDSDKVAKVKDLLSKLDLKSQKRFAESYKAEKGV